MPYYHVRITLNSDPSNVEVELDLSLEKLNERFVGPYRSGKPIVISGRAITSEDIRSVQINKTQRDSQDLNTVLLQQQMASGSYMMVDHKGRLPADLLADNGENVTSEFITGPPGYEMEESNITTQQSRPATSMRVFISHSDNDIEVAKLLIDLLRMALQLRSDEIRCTSVDGYRMPGGASIDERLRTEVHDAELLIGLITPASLRSAYVIFELGARWGAEKPMIPLLASGATPEDLEGPLSGINALDSSVDGQVHQFLEETANHLNLSLDKASSYAAEVNALVQLSSTPKAMLEKQPTNTVGLQLSEDAAELLSEAASSSDDTIMAYKVMAGLGISTRSRSFVEPGDRRAEARWKRALEELEQYGLIEALSDKREVFQLTDAGFKMADTLNVSQKESE